MKRSGISSLDMTTTMMRFIFTVFCALFIVINNIFVCDGRESKMIKDWAKVGNFSRFYDKYICIVFSTKKLKIAYYKLS